MEVKKASHNAFFIFSSVVVSWLDELDAIEISSIIFINLTFFTCSCICTARQINIGCVLWVNKQNCLGFKIKHIPPFGEDFYFN